MLVNYPEERSLKTKKVHTDDGHRVIARVTLTR